MNSGARICLTRILRSQKDLANCKKDVKKMKAAFIRLELLMVLFYWSRISEEAGKDKALLKISYFTILDYPDNSLSYVRPTCYGEWKGNSTLCF